MRGSREKIMSWYACAGATLAVLVCCAGSARADAQVDDAYARGSSDGKTWTIGTSAVELVLESRDGLFRLVNYRNKLVSPAVEYVDSAAAAAPFALNNADYLGRFAVTEVWTKYLPGSATADPANDNVRIAVEKGELIGFAVGPHGDFISDQTQWITTLDYGGGEVYTSSQDATLDQGPMWYYYVYSPGTAFLDQIDSIVSQCNAQENVRIPSPASPYRSAGDTPHVGATMFHPSNSYDAVRVWKAPRAGTVTIRGKAQHLRGGGDVDLKILRVKDKGDTPQPAPGDNEWTLVSANTSQVSAGGRPAVQLDIMLSRSGLRANLHLLAYPRTSIVRQWFELENTGSAPYTLASVTPLLVNTPGGDAGSLTHYWMTGASNSATQGTLQTAPVAATYDRQVVGRKTVDFIPWMALQRSADPADGWFWEMDFIGTWRMAVTRGASGPVTVSASLPEFAGRQLAPGQKLALPMITLGGFKSNLDDLGQRAYDWQYEYMWDYTHHDWYGLMQFAVPWYNDVRNLQENFAGRLSDLDVSGVDLMRTVGMEVLWDDAGWSENPNIWAPSREGPDFAQTLRYLPKTGMKWVLWFCGQPTRELMDTKVGSWGNFQWRTDGQPLFDLPLDQSWRGRITGFLQNQPRASFQTTDGGSCYAHTFDYQRYADINMYTDPGGGDQTNYFMSYFETPDKWMDLMPSFYTAGGYLPDTSRQILAMVPCWDQRAAGTDAEQLRKLCEIYRYLRDQGVAGRWVRTYHPVVSGDTAHYYTQRTSYDGTKACIILKHRTANDVTVFPRGLLAGHSYAVGFDSTQATTTRTGADLMANGILIHNQAPGELIYLGLPDRPGSGRDTVAPQAPGRVLTRRESNIGQAGVGVYWSPGSDDKWVSYYEVRRGVSVLGKVSVGTYYFDHAEEWSPSAQYHVRTVDGDGHMSGWTASARLADEPRIAAVQGGHFPQSGREGWSYETTTDAQAFTPMTFVPPVKSAAGNVGGTGNQVGGVEGYWEGAGTARCGRGWQQASASAKCIRTWTAPQAGTVRIVGRAMKEYYRRADGGPLRVSILHGVQQVWPASGWASLPVGDLFGAQHDLTVSVAAGDKIRFVLDTGAAPDSDVISWMPRVIYADPEPTGDGMDVVRILCGSQTPYTDSLGNEWSADRCFAGGAAVSSSAVIEGTTPNVSDQRLYQAGRQGSDFTYTIPVRPGLYALRLKFAEAQYDWAYQRPFDLTINGRAVLNSFDIRQEARSARKAFEQVFRYLTPDANGQLVLHFTGGWDPLAMSDQAMVQAIEVTPEIKPVIRIAAGASADYVDWNSYVWSADTGFVGGHAMTATAPVSQASPTIYDQRLYQTARSGQSFTYTVSVPPGMYTVHLKFAELWLQQLGQRPMNIDVNGRRVWENWDPATAAGLVNMAADIRTEDVTPDKDGHITVRISAAGSNEAILQGLEIE